MLLFNKLATMSERRTFKQNEYMEYDVKHISGTADINIIANNLINHAFKNGSVVIKLIAISLIDRVCKILEYAFSGIKNNYFEASSFDEFFDESLEQYSRMLDNTQDMSDSDGPEFVFPFKYNGDVNIFQISLMPKQYSSV